MSTFSITLFVWLFLLVLVGIWFYFFIYSYTHAIIQPWGFALVFIGLIAEGLGIPFYTADHVVFFKINVAFLLCLLAILLNINDIQKQFYVGSVKEFSRLLGVGLVLGLLFWCSIRIFVGYKDIKSYVGYMPIAVILLNVQISILEEIIHRGLFLRFLTQYGFSQISAIIFQALFFAAVHVSTYWGNWGALGCVFLFGLIANYLTLKYNNLICPIILHVTANLLAVMWWWIISLL